MAEFGVTKSDVVILSSLPALSKHIQSEAYQTEAT